MIESTLDRGARLLRQRVAATAESIGKRFPHYADPPTGETGAEDWPGAFWVAMCWLSARQSFDQRYGIWARRWAERLDVSAPPVNCRLRPYYGAVVAAVLCDDAQSRSSALAAAQTLSTTFDPTAGICSDGSGETAISTVPGVALLAWAARQSDRDDWRAMAVGHARRHIEFCIRPTGSVWSSVVFDRVTGAVTRRFARKGCTTAAPGPGVRPGES